jgi:hypothetical protein
VNQGKLSLQSCSVTSIEVGSHSHRGLNELPRFLVIHDLVEPGRQDEDRAEPGVRSGCVPALPLPRLAPCRVLCCAIMPPTVVTKAGDTHSLGVTLGPCRLVTHAGPLSAGTHPARPDLRSVLCAAASRLCDSVQATAPL